MIEQGYRGISFPFRVGVKGGIVMTSTSSIEVPHIIESISQILRTFRLERTMEPHIYSEIDLDVFEPNNISAQSLLEYQIKDALRRLEPRIEVLDVKLESEDSKLYALISFKVLYYDSDYVTKLKVGDLNVKTSYS